MFILDKIKSRNNTNNKGNENLEVGMNLSNKDDDIKSVSFEVIKTVLYTDTLEEIF